jgi:hypothetical protein
VSLYYTVSNCIMNNCYSSRMRFGLAPPPCVNSAPTDRGLVGSRFTTDTDRPKFLNMFKTIGTVRQSADSPDCLRTAGGPARGLSVGPCPTDGNRETDWSVSGPLDLNRPLIAYEHVERMIQKNVQVIKLNKKFLVYACRSKVFLYYS